MTFIVVFNFSTLESVRLHKWDWSNGSYFFLYLYRNLVVKSHSSWIIPVVYLVVRCDTYWFKVIAFSGINTEILSLNTNCSWIIQVNYTDGKNDITKKNLC